MDKFRDWLNGTMMTSFRSFILTVIAACILITFTIVASVLVLDRSSAASALNKDPGLRAAAQTTESAHHSTGKEIITLIFAFLTAAIVTNAASQFGDRVTSKEHVEAKERGRVAGAAIAANMTNGTKEHQAQEPSTKVNINTTVEGDK